YTPLFRSSAWPDGDRSPADRQVSADADLTAEHHIVFDVCAPGDTDLRGHQHIAADGHAMADLHQVVDLGAGLDAGFTNSGPIHRRVRTQLQDRKSVV